MGTLILESIGGSRPVGPRVVSDRDHHGFVEAVGERIALFGAEDGRMEVWMWPLLLLHDLEVRIAPAGGAPRAPGERRVEVVPEGLSLTWEADGAAVTMTAVAAQRDRGIVLIFEVELETAPVDLVLTFEPAMRPMWPAGLGGQLVGRDETTGAAALSEEVGRFAALVGSPDAAPLELAVVRGPHAPIELRIRVDRQRDAGDPLVVAIAGAAREATPLTDAELRGGTESATGVARAAGAVDEARRLLQRLWSDWREVVAAERERWRAFLDATPALESGDASLDAAFLWSKIALERAWIEVEDVGRGVVAGYGASSGGARPGRGWFFNGDAFEACRAYAALGRYESCREILRFAASTQREDGKLSHQVSLSAGLCDWFGDYPYAYYKGNQTPEFLVTLADFAAWSGDDDFVGELWSTAERAFDWCQSTAGSDGVMRVPEAGLAAGEAGPATNHVEAEIFLQGSWLSAQRAMLTLGEIRGVAVEVHRSALEGRLGAAPFRDRETGVLAFARLVDGSLLDVATTHAALPIARGVMEASDAEVLALNGPVLTADWGSRSFGAASDASDATCHDLGGVQPSLTQHTALALYARGFDDAGWQVLRSQAALVGIGGPCVLPEFLAGDRARLMPHSVPHQVSSHAALIRLVTDALFGIRPGTSETAPRVPFELDAMALRGMHARGDRFDVVAERDIMELRPRIALPWQVDAYAPSANPRLVAIEDKGAETAWTIAGPAATTVRLKFEMPTGTRVDGARVDGGELVIAFPTVIDDSPYAAVGFGATTVRFVSEPPA